MKTTISPHIFRAYDIRGLYNKDLTPEIMHKIGLAAGTYIKTIINKENLTVGNDIRQSSIPLIHAFIAGVVSTGINVITVGTSAFGQALFKGWKNKTGASVFITASHLPPEWNGIKFYHTDGVGFSEEELMKIRDIAIKEEYSLVKWSEIGTVTREDPTKNYINFFKEKFNYENPIKVALDCGGGSTTLSAPEVFDALGLDIEYIYCEPDPSFSKRPSDPKPKNLSKVVEIVKEKQCDFGVAFDGDGDRSVIIDNKGRILSADQTGIIIGTYGLKEKKGTIIVNVECSKSVQEQLEPLGFSIKQIPVGHTYLTIEAKMENSPLGIESSGHLILPEYFLFDDALVIPLKIAEILDKTDKNLSDIVDKIPTYLVQKEEIECTDQIKFEVVDYLRSKFKEEYTKINTMDGVRVELEKGWVLIRPSNTSPIIRLTVEADNEDILGKLALEFKTKTLNAIEKLKGLQG